MDLQFYIEGQRVELFKDETIQINSTVQNISDISKTFTDFTKSFTVPASSKNNKIFKHWDLAEINGGFDAKIKKDAILELNYIPFRKGKVVLNSVQKKNGVANNYKVTFFGHLVSLADLFGEDLLTDLNLSAYEHNYTSDNVKDGLSNSTFFSGNVIYPLLSNERVWTWGDEGVDDIKWKSGATWGLNFYELKPALRLKAIINAIKTKYGINFSDHFFGVDEFLDLYMWASNDKGAIKAKTTPITLSWSGTSTLTTTGLGHDQEDDYRNTFALSTTVTGYETIPYTIVVMKNGVQDASFNLTGNAIISFEDWGLVNNNYQFILTSDLPLGYSIVIDQDEVIGISSPVQIFGGTTAGSTIDALINFTDTTIDGVIQKGQLPKLKVGDFLIALIKMFNLVIIPTDSNKFDVITLDQWYENGAVRDLTKYIDISKEDISRLNIHKVINFNYKESETILATNFRETNNISYGDLEAEFDYDGDVFNIELPFENILFSKLSDQDGVITDIRVGNIIDKELNPVKTNPIIFYKTATTFLINDLGFIEDDGTLVAVTKYNNVGQENALSNVSVTSSLNWGSEVSSQTLTSLDESLFSNYWQTFLTNLYDENRRVFKFDGVLPVKLLTQLKLNDKIIINNRRYIINNLNINLTNGKVKFELLNDLVAPTPIEVSTENGLEYGLEFELE